MTWRELRKLIDSDLPEQALDSNVYVTVFEASDFLRESRFECKWYGKADTPPKIDATLILVRK